MLVLTRKIGESIRIDGQICVTVMEVDGRTVKIGIEAPRTVLIHREEVWLRILEENQRAASVEAASVDLGSMANLFKQGGAKPGASATTPDPKTDTKAGDKSGDK